MRGLAEDWLVCQERICPTELVTTLSVARLAVWGDICSCGCCMEPRAFCYQSSPLSWNCSPRRASTWQPPWKEHFIFTIYSGLELLGDLSNENISIAGVGEGWPVGTLRPVICRLSTLLIYIWGFSLIKNACYAHMTKNVMIFESCTVLCNKDEINYALWTLEAGSSDIFSQTSLSNAS